MLTGVYIYVQKAKVERSVPNGWYRGWCDGEDENINLRRRGWSIPCTAKRHLGRYVGDDGLSRNPSYIVAPLEPLLLAWALPYAS